MKKNFYVQIVYDSFADSKTKQWIVSENGCMFLEKSADDSGFDPDTGSAVGTAFTFEEAVFNAKTMTSTALFNGYSGVKSFIFRLTSKGLVKVRKHRKQVCQAKYGVRFSYN